MKRNLNKSNALQSGFTLMEMIGVMAVIAILASAAAPPIFDAIEDSKVSAYIQEVHTLKFAVAKYYKDTGKWPRHEPTSTVTQYHQLMVNDANGSGTPITGWNGPYLEQELTNQISKGAFQLIISTSDTRYICDIDGDGTKDGSFLTYRIDGVSDKIAKKISNIVDGDGSITEGDTRWQAAGKVKRHGENSDSTSILVYCITTS